jgi:hypothetical protein
MCARFSRPRQGRHRIVRQLTAADKKLPILQMNKERNDEKSRNDARMSMKTNGCFGERKNEASMSVKTQTVSFKMAECC